ncbi:MAG: ATP-dependent Clp protease ATP-binding subunit ClpC [Actinomycetota bacterium]|jgi:ATP-dependent Clp protease ATP-binding subunit ClpA|nr:ATP-dependent Clp protease ATP-binding subunit ClpC [Actinomycetota bacterium]
MFERFTDRARRVVVLAQEEARLLDHDYIGTEHLLLGLIQEREGLAAKALEELGISLDNVRTQVVDMIGRGVRAPKGHIPFTARAKKVLEFSLRSALELGHNYIGTEHILLGLIREGTGVAAQVLGRLGADAQRVRDQVTALLSEYAAAGRARPEAITSIPYEAANLAGGKVIEPEHYLLAILALPDTRAARALAALGVTREALETALAALDPPGPPAEGGAPPPDEGQAPPPDEGQAPSGP